jgi:hypothetical protein
MERFPIFTCSAKLIFNPGSQWPKLLFESLGLKGAQYISRRHSVPLL